MADIAPTFGWICTDPRLSAMAEAMLDEGYEELSMKPGHPNLYRLGRIGSLNVVINCLSEPSRATDSAQMAQSMATSFSSLKAIMITGFGGGVPSAGIKFGDLIISPIANRNHGNAESSSTTTQNIVQRAAHILQREVGPDGHWLSSNLSLAVSNLPDLPQLAQRPSRDPPDYPQLHYGIISSKSQDVQNEQLLDRLAAVKNVIGLETVAAGIRAGNLM